MPALAAAPPNHVASSPSNTTSQQPSSPSVARSNSTSYTHPTSDTDTVRNAFDVEPDDEWKDNMKRSIEENLGSMLQDAKVSLEKKIADNPHQKDALVQDHLNNTLPGIRRMGADTYQAELVRERQERAWALGKNLPPSSFFKEQQEIMNKFQSAKSATTSSSISTANTGVNSSASTSAGTQAKTHPDPSVNTPPSRPRAGSRPTNIRPPISFPTQEYPIPSLPPELEERRRASDFHGGGGTKNREELSSSMRRPPWPSADRDPRPHLPESWAHVSTNENDDFQRPPSTSASSVRSKPSLNEVRTGPGPNGTSPTKSSGLDRSRTLSDRHLATSPPGKSMHEIWKPAISPEEDAAAAKQHYPVGRRNSNASMRSIGSTASSIRHPPTETIPERADDGSGDSEVSSSDRKGKGKEPIPFSAAASRPPSSTSSGSPAPGVSTSYTKSPLSEDPALREREYSNSFGPYTALQRPPRSSLSSLNGNDERERYSTPPSSATRTREFEFEDRRDHPDYMNGGIASPGPEYHEPIPPRAYYDRPNLARLNSHTRPPQNHREDYDGRDEGYHRNSIYASPSIPVPGRSPNPNVASSADQYEDGTPNSLPGTSTLGSWRDWTLNSHHSPFPDRERERERDRERHERPAWQGSLRGRPPDTYGGWYGGNANGGTRERERERFAEDFVEDFDDGHYSSGAAIRRRADTESKRVDELRKRDEMLTTREDEVKKREEDMKKRESDLRKKDEELTGRDNKITLREERAKAREQDLEDQERELTKKNKDADGREQDVAKRMAAVEKREESAQRQLADVRAVRDLAKKTKEEAKAKEDEVAKREEVVRNLETTTKEVQARVEATEKSFGEREEELKRKDGILKQREEEIKRKEEEAKKKSMEAKKKDLELNRRVEDVSSKEAALNNRENDLKAKEGDLTKREKDVRGREDEVTILREELEDQQRDVADQEKDVELREDELNRMKKALEVREEEVKAKLIELQKREYELLNKMKQKLDEGEGEKEGDREWDRERKERDREEERERDREKQKDGRRQREQWQQEHLERERQERLQWEETEKLQERKAHEERLRQKQETERQQKLDDRERMREREEKSRHEWEEQQRKQAAMQEAKERDAKETREREHRERDARFKQEQERMRQQMEYQQRRDAELKRQREERKRQDSAGPDNPWSGTSSSPGPGTNRVPPTRANSTTAPDGWSTSNGSSARSASSGSSAWTSAKATSASSTASNATPRPKPASTPHPQRKPSTGSGAYPSAPMSEAERQRRAEEETQKQHERFRLEQERLETARQAKLARGSLSTDDMMQVYLLHEKQWEMLPKRDELHWDHFPWPMFVLPRDPEQITGGAILAYLKPDCYPGKDKSMSLKDRIKDQIKKWHPDRFDTKLLPKVADSEKEVVKIGSGTVVRYLNDLLDKAPGLMSI